MYKETWKNISSRIFGKFASREFHPIFQKIVNRTYVKLMKLDLSEFEHYKTYPSLNALFTRAFKTKRKYSKHEDSFISPCDGLISSCGKLDKNTLLQIKGFEYSVDDLLGEHIQEVNKVYDKSYMNFYLAPSDYHRYHAPLDMKIKKAVYIPGDLYPVNFKYLRKITSLFSKNERVVLECMDDKDNRFFMVFVGAFNVGKMVFDFDERIDTNANAGETKVYEYEDLSIKKAEQLGFFKMGSTIVMIFEDENITLNVKTDNKIKFTDIIATRGIENKN